MKNYFTKHTTEDTSILLMRGSICFSEIKSLRSFSFTMPPSREDAIHIKTKKTTNSLNAMDPQQLSLSGVNIYSILFIKGFLSLEWIFIWFRYTPKLYV